MKIMNKEHFGMAIIFTCIFLFGMTCVTVDKATWARKERQKQQVIDAERALVMGWRENREGPEPVGIYTAYRTLPTGEVKTYQLFEYHTYEGAFTLIEFGTRDRFKMMGDIEIRKNR